MSYLDALKAEIRILVRAIVVSQKSNIMDLNVKWKKADSTPITLDYPDVVKLIAQPSPGTPEEVTVLLGFLQAVRDELIRMARPATGYSIAYTSLVAGDEQGVESDATYQLALQAFGGLANKAQRHKLSIRLVAFCTLIIAIFASWEAAKVALGRGLLQTLEPLRAQQIKIADEKKQLETDTGPGSDASEYPIHPICERYQAAILNKGPEDKVSSALLSGKDSARIRDICGRDQILSANFRMVHQGLGVYLKDLRMAVPGVLAPVDQLASASEQAASSGASATSCSYTGSQSTSPQASGQSPTSDQSDVEFWVAPVAQVITGFILPFTFGVIGSLLYVLLQHYTNLRAGLLEPHDHGLAYIRIVLGIAVAISMSLLIASNAGPSTPLVPAASGSTSPASLVGSLTFSPSLITFLAGFGAEAVFTLLQNLVDRVFALEKP